MKKKPYDRILREKPKKQHISTVPNSDSYIYACVCVIFVQGCS